MGTHPIFESDFDCLTEKRMNRVAVPGSCALLAAGIAQRFWKKGWKDFGLLFGIGSAVCCYFCIWDLKRASDPVYKKNLYNKRKEAYSQSLCRPITEKLLKPLVEKYGSLDILKHPMQGQQVMMQYIQKGEMALQQGMEGEAINSFSMAACISYIGQGVTKAEQLLSTISNMIPQMGPVLNQEFSADKEAVDEFMKTLPSPKPMVSRENFFKNLQAQAKKPEITEAEELDEDSIDESDKEEEKEKIVEMPEEDVEEVKVAEPEAKVMAEAPEVEDEEPAEEPISTPEIITSQEVTEANETPEAFSVPVTEETSNPSIEKEPAEETKIEAVGDAEEVEEDTDEEISEEKVRIQETERVIQEAEEVLEGGDEESEEEEEIVETEQVGDAPVIEKVTINQSTPTQENEMEDEELE